MVYKDDPDHARLRRLVNKAFTPRMVQEMSQDIEGIVDALLNGLSGRETVDLVADFAVPLPLSVISRMLGVSASDRDQFQSLTARFVAGVGGGSPAAFIRTIPAARKLLAMIERMAQERRQVPDQGMISALVAASDDGEQTEPGRGCSDDLPPHAGRSRHDLQSHRKRDVGLARASGTSSRG